MSIKPDMIIAYNNNTFEFACQCGNIRIVEWLLKIKPTLQPVYLNYISSNLRNHNLLNYYYSVTPHLFILYYAAKLNKCKLSNDIIQ